MFIFSYGSNMLGSRLHARLNSARFHSVGTLEHHSLQFNKRGKDMSAKANAFFTGNKKDVVWGVVWEIDEAQKPILDRIEGLKEGYDEKYEKIRMKGGIEKKVQLFYAMEDYIDNNIRPFDWYWHFVVLGAMENELPEAYIQRILEFEYVNDTDKERSLANRRILQQSPGYKSYLDRIGKEM